MDGTLVGEVPGDAGRIFEHPVSIRQELALRRPAAGEGSPSRAPAVAHLRGLVCHVNSAPSSDAPDPQRPAPRRGGEEPMSTDSLDLQQPDRFRCRRLRGPAHRRPTTPNFRDKAAPPSHPWVRHGTRPARAFQGGRPRGPRPRRLVAANPSWDGIAVVSPPRCPGAAWERARTPCGSDRRDCDLDIEAEKSPVTGTAEQVSQKWKLRLRREHGRRQTSHDPCRALCADSPRPRHVQPAPRGGTSVRRRDVARRSPRRERPPTSRRPTTEPPSRSLPASPSSSHGVSTRSTLASRRESAALAVLPPPLSRSP